MELEELIHPITASICRYFKKRYIKNLPIRREEKF
jgi:hypothetical protein